MKKIKRGIAFLLCMSMLFGIAPYSAYATGSDAALNPIEEPVPDQDLESTEEGIVELDWTTCKDADLEENNTFVKASGKGITGVSAIWDEECAEFVASQYGYEFDVYRVQVDGYEEGDSLTLAFDIETAYYPSGIDNLKLYRIDTYEGVINTKELTIQKKELHTVVDNTEADDVEEYDIEFVTVTFETTRTGVFAIGNVEEMPEEPQIRELIIKNLPSKLEYQLEEEFDRSGLEVAYVENGVETILPEDEYEVTGADLSIIGQQTVTVTYGELTASFDIMVCEPEEVQTGELIIKKLPTKLVYQLGEAFDASGLEVARVENDIETPLSINECTVAADLSTKGQQTVTVTYGELTASFGIWVCDPNNPTKVGIYVKELPTKTEYVVGEPFDSAGLVVAAYYDNDTEQEIATYLLSEADTMTLGINPVTVTEGSHTTVFYITVEESQPEPVEEEMTVTLEDGSEIPVKIETSARENVTYQITDVHNYIWVNTLLSKVYDGDFVVLDIQPDENFIPGEKTTVTLPLPEHITSPAVYCLTEEDGIVERIMDVTVENDMVSFVTDHFSVYAIGDGISGEKVPSEAIVTKAWVPLNGWAKDKRILILDTGSKGLAHAMASDGSDVVDQTVIILSEGNQVYIPISDVPDNAVWTTEKSNNQWKFKDYRGNYLGTNDRLGNHALVLDDTATLFSLSSDGKRLYYYWIQYYRIKYGNNQWYVDNEEFNLAFFEEGTVSRTYQLRLKIDNEVSTGAYTFRGDEVGHTLNVSYFDVPDGGTISYESLNPEIATVDANGKVTFTGNEGKTVIQASYTWEENGQSYTTKAYFDLFAEKPVYTIDIVDSAGQSITNTIPIKNVTPNYEHQLGAKLTRDEVEVSNPARVTWMSSDESIATVDANGKVIFTGKEGSVGVTVLYTYADGSSSVTDKVMFSVKQDDVTIPSDGTDDFPEYPNEGSIRFDKHATAVGNFSDTGVVQVELSMTGVPYTVGNEIDVVMMLDMSTSISEVDGRHAAAIDAAQAALETLVKNEDGSFNGNRVAIYGFNGWDSNGGTSNTYNNKALDVYENAPDDTDKGTSNVNITKISGMQTYNASNYNTTIQKIENDYDLDSGTNYAAALRQCYLTLQATKDPNREQYVIFMTDGFASTGFAYKANNSNGYSMFYYGDLGSNGLDGITDNNVKVHTKTEYFSDLMKNDGVEIFTVGLQVGKGVTTNNTYIEAGKTVLKNIAGTDEGNANDSNFADHAMFVEANDNVSKIVDIFKTITMSIKQAATNVVVTDKIADEYTMIFEPPASNTTATQLPTGQELYIEVLDYQLDEVKENGTIVDYVRGSSTSLAKIYLKKSNGNFYAASNNAGTKFAAPVMKAVTDGETKSYWKLTDANDYDIIANDGRYYKFAPKGDGGYIMESGAYASGTENGNLKIASPYFFYNASTRILVWTSEKLSSSELALSYFLYLDKSAGWEGSSDQTLPGTYETNDYATLRYTNHLGNNCEQEFPVPQMTWNGAQVSYVFYLVNDNGQPVNRAGRVIPFSEAVYITDVFTESIVWNDLEESGRLTAGILAEEKVPDIYTLYDQEAAYTIHVFEDEEGANLNNHFKIDGSASKNTTYVFNTKSDAEKYNELGIYAGKQQILCKDYDVTVTNGSYKYNGKLGQYIDTENNKPIYGTEIIDGVEEAYTIVYQNVSQDKIVDDGFDFSNTTVAFAVRWIPKLIPDTVVIDYGLDTVIDVAYNDGISGDVIGVRTDSHSNAPLNQNNGYSNMCEADRNATADVYLNNSSGENFKIGTAYVENNTSVRFSLDKENGMQMKDWAKFYYESSMSYYEGTELLHQDMYTSVTVIPATTIYYEDEYVTLTGNWTPSKNVTDTQQVDRPGPDKVGALYDADNEYGSDAAYLKCSTTSMDGSAWIHVGTEKKGTAEFEFYGTGFDIISATSHKTGTIVVQVTGSDNKTKNYVVDTYYGYRYISEGELTDYNHDGKIDEKDRWILIDDEQKAQDNALWQIPVMKVVGLPYGHYTVKITVSYSGFFDHDQYGDDNPGYDFYLDAIRIYDPAGRENANQVIKDAYIADREYLPEYYELRNMVIESGTFDAISEDDEITGIVFIDGKDNVTTADISDYESYGPNNELYLAPGQSVVFNLNTQREDGYAVDMVQLAWKSVGGIAKAKIWNPNKMNVSEVKEVSVETATDMYFDITNITDLTEDDRTVVIQNTGNAENGDSILSITNIKVTAKIGSSEEEPPAAQELAMFSVSRSAVRQALLSLNNEIVEPEPPKKEEPNPVPETPVPEPPKKEESTPTPEPPKKEESTPTPESPKKEESTPTPETPKTEETTPVPETAVPETPAPESPKMEETKPIPESSAPESSELEESEMEETVEEPSKSADGEQVMDDLENQESETEKPEETTEIGIIGRLIEFIKMLISSIFDWFDRWF